MSITCVCLLNRVRISRQYVLELLNLKGSCHRNSDPLNLHCNQHKVQLAMRLEGQLPICLCVKKLSQQIFIPNHVLFTQHKMVGWLRNSPSEDDKRHRVTKLVDTKLKLMTKET